MNLCNKDIAMNYCIYNNPPMKNSARKKGRPPKEITLSEVLPPIRVTPDQKVTYRKAAESSGMSLSAWLKAAAEKQLAQSDFNEKEA